MAKKERTGELCEILWLLKTGKWGDGFATIGPLKDDSESDSDTENTQAARALTDNSESDLDTENAKDARGFSDDSDLEIETTKAARDMKHQKKNAHTDGAEAAAAGADDGNDTALALNARILLAVQAALPGAESSRRRVAGQILLSSMVASIYWWSSPAATACWQCVFAIVQNVPLQRESSTAMVERKENNVNAELVRDIMEKQFQILRKQEEKQDSTSELAKQIHQPRNKRGHGIPTSRAVFLLSAAGEAPKTAGLYRYTENAEEHTWHEEETRYIPAYTADASEGRVCLLKDTSRRTSAKTAEWLRDVVGESRGNCPTGASTYAGIVRDEILASLRAVGIATEANPCVPKKQKRHLRYLHIRVLAWGACAGSWPSYGAGLERNVENLWFLEGNFKGKTQWPPLVADLFTWCFRQFCTTKIDPTKHNTPRTGPLAMFIGSPLCECLILSGGRKISNKRARNFLLHLWSILARRGDEVSATLDLLFQFLEPSSIRRKCKDFVKGYSKRLRTGAATPMEKVEGPATPMEKVEGPATPMEKVEGPPTPMSEVEGPPTPMAEVESPATPMAEVEGPATAMAEVEGAATPMAEFEAITALAYAILPRRSPPGELRWVKNTHVHAQNTPATSIISYHPEPEKRGSLRAQNTPVKSRIPYQEGSLRALEKEEHYEERIRASSHKLGGELSREEALTKRYRVMPPTESRQGVAQNNPVGGDRSYSPEPKKGGSLHHEERSYSPAPQMRSKSSPLPRHPEPSHLLIGTSGTRSELISTLTTLGLANTYKNVDARWSKPLLVALEFANHGSLGDGSLPEEISVIVSVPVRVESEEWRRADSLLRHGFAAPFRMQSQKEIAPSSVFWYIEPPANDDADALLVQRGRNCAALWSSATGLDKSGATEVAMLALFTAASGSLRFDKPTRPSYSPTSIFPKGIGLDIMLLATTRPGALLIVLNCFLCLPFQVCYQALQELSPLKLCSTVPRLDASLSDERVLCKTIAMARSLVAVGALPNVSVVSATSQTLWLHSQRAMCQLGWFLPRNKLSRLLFVDRSATSDATAITYRSQRGYINAVRPPDLSSLVEEAYVEHILIPGQKPSHYYVRPDPWAAWLSG
jgi:hypothetical protein